MMIQEATIQAALEAAEHSILEMGMMEKDREQLALDAQLHMVEAVTLCLTDIADAIRESAIKG